MCFRGFPLINCCIITDPKTIALKRIKTFFIAFFDFVYDINKVSFNKTIPVIVAMIILLLE